MWTPFKQDNSKWSVVEVEPGQAAKMGIPTRIPAPTKQAAKITMQGLSIADVLSWARQFVEEEPNSELVSGLQVFMSKQALWDSARPLLENENWGEAEGILNQILQVDPKDAIAHFNLGAVYRNTGALDSSLKSYRLCESVFGSDLLFYTNRARTYEAKGRKDDAVSDYKHALKITPGDSFALDRLAQLGELVELYADPGDISSKRYMDKDAYEATVRSDLESHKNDVNYLIQRAEGNLKDKRPQLALEASERALAASPNCPEACLMKGVALGQLARHKEAKAALLKYNDLAPDSGWGYLNIAKIVWAQKGRRACKPYLEKALNKDPNILNALQMLLLPDEGQDVKDAIGQTEAFAAKYPTAWAPWRLLGDLHHRAGRIDQTIIALGEAAKRNADDQTVAFYLGALGESGRLSELVALVDGLPDLAQRSIEIRHNAAQAYVEAGRIEDAKKLLRTMADDAALPPNWRQNFRERLKALETQ